MTQGGPFLVAAPWSHRAGKRQSAIDPVTSGTSQSLMDSPPTRSAPYQWIETSLCKLVIWSRVIGRVLDLGCCVGDGVLDAAAWRGQGFAGKAGSLPKGEPFPAVRRWPRASASWRRS